MAPHRTVQRSFKDLSRLEGGTSLFNRGCVNDSPPDAVVVAVGLEARSWGGIEDQAMYSISRKSPLGEIWEDGLLRIRLDIHYSEKKW